MGGLIFTDRRHKARRVGDKTLFDTVGAWPLSKAKPPTIRVPFAADGSCFNPFLCRRTGKFTVGEKGNEVKIDNFYAALAYLKAMKAAHWRRPNKAGDWGRVIGVRWGSLPRKYSSPNSSKTIPERVQSSVSKPPTV
jgi:hypothetical protein